LFKSFFKSFSKISINVQADKTASLLAELLNMIGSLSNQSHSNARRAG